MSGRGLACGEYIVLTVREDLTRVVTEFTHPENVFSGLARTFIINFIICILLLCVS